MAYFDKDYLKFFRELEKNNHKDWFDENRKRYEKVIKDPFKAFVNDLVKELQTLFPDDDLSDKFSIMRINRDIRFSKDKTPYKIFSGAMISPRSKKDASYPGMYIQANHQDLRVYSGSHMLEKDQLQAVRNYIKDNLQEFNKLISEKKFKDTFGDILGDKNKRIPPEFREVEKEQPLIANKNFYWFFKVEPEVVLADDAIQIIMSKFKHAMPLNKFFEEALDFN